MPHELRHDDPLLVIPHHVGLGTRVPHRIRTREDMLIPAGVLDADPVMRPENNIVRTSKSRDAPSLRQ
jgi:hypothetical protein